MKIVNSMAQIIAFRVRKKQEQLMISTCLQLMQNQSGGLKEHTVFNIGKFNQIIRALKSYSFALPLMRKM